MSISGTPIAKADRAGLRLGQGIITLPLCLGLAVAAAVSTAHAETAVSGERRTFDIAPQPLYAALNALAEQSGVQFAYNAGWVKGIRSPGVQGQYSLEGALHRLLADSGLSYQIINNGNTVTLHKTATPKADEPQSALTMPPVTVSGAAEYDSTDPYNPDYNRTTASTATKTDTPIMDTPLSIQVVPKAVIDDQQAVRVGDALKNVSGYFDNRGEEYVYDEAYLRGFNTNTRQYVDGLRDLPQSHSLANIERIEVLKGPAGALYGRLDPGGLINYVTKRPMDTPYYSLQQQFGSFDLYRTLADATGPITRDGSLLYRVNMEYLSSHSFIDVVSKERGFIAPSLTWKISPQTQVDVDFRYHDVNGPTTFGLPAVGNRPANVPISHFMGESGDNGDSSLLYGGMSLAHAFSDNWKLSAKVGYNYQNAKSGGTFINSLDEQTGDASRFYSYYDYFEDSIQGLINLTGKFDTYGLKHTLTVGGDIYHTHGRTGKSYFLLEGVTNSFPPPINIYQPIAYGLPGIDLDRETASGGSNTETFWWGLYVQDQITILDDWHLMFGTRYDQVTNNSSWGKPADDGEFSPRVGLLYRPLQWLSMYANYVKAMNAANVSPLVPGARRVPEMSEGWEGGIKGEWWDGRLTAGLTYYELTKRNSAHFSGQFGDGRPLNILVGEARSQGIEFDVSGRLTDYWSLIGTYSYTDTEFTKALAATQGKQFANVPKHAASLWSKYEFGGFGIPGLWAGSGVFVADQRQGDRVNSFQLPGYARVDAALGYSFHAGPSKISLQFNIDNLLDKRYYASSTWETRTYGIQPGASRTFLGSVRVEF